MEYIEKIHNEILDIMVFIDKLCQDNDLKYYLIGGTLLGAVRHQGFIPWDDDLDIVMPRSDFNKFIGIMEQQSFENYQLSWITNRQDYYLTFAKVERKNTCFQNADVLNSNYHQGIYIDIFPLDDVKGYSRKVEFRKKIIWFMTDLRYYKTLTFNCSPVKKTISTIFTWFLTQRTLSKIQLSFMTKENKNQCEYYANYGSNYSIKKQTMPKAYYGSGTKILFEGHEFNAPAMTSDILSSIYGPNYMQLPPPEKRVTHNPAYVKFSDGEEMRFSSSHH